jgi:hypothetical protein
MVWVELVGSASTTLVVGIGGDGLGMGDGSQSDEAVVVTHTVEQVSDAGTDSVWWVGSGNEVGMSVVATLDQLQIVPEADAEDARSVQVPGVGAPDESGTQHWRYASWSGAMAWPHCGYSRAARLLTPTEQYL